MDLLLDTLLFVVSLIVLVRSSDWFVNSAEAIGLSLGIPPFIIGVTIVAFGTSLPELATSIAAVLDNNSEIVIGNVIGSNITNIALVLGLTAVVVKKIDLEEDLWHIDFPFLLATAFLLWFVLMDQQITLVESIVLLTGIGVFLAYSLKSDIPKEAKENRPTANIRQYAMLVGGGVLVYFSADFTIQAVSAISLKMGIAPRIIALSAVALGTSLPEVVVSLTAARKGKSSIAVGNVLGSNVFNTLIVTGIPALIGPLAIPSDILSFYLPLMIVMTILFGVMSKSGRISRWEGLALLLFYLLFFNEIFRSGLSS